MRACYFVGSCLKNFTKRNDFFQMSVEEQPIDSSKINQQAMAAEKSK